MTNKKGDTVTNKKGHQERQARRKADTLSGSKADTLRKRLEPLTVTCLGSTEISWRQMNRNAGKGKRADASSAGTEPGKQK